MNEVNLNVEKEPMRLNFEENKIIDILMHAATREDIAAARNELKGEIKELRTELKGNITELRTELKGDISELNIKTDKINDKIDKVIWFILLSILTPIILQFGPHFVK